MGKIIVIWYSCQQSFFVGHIEEEKSGNSWLIMRAGGQCFWTEDAREEIFRYKNK